MICELYLSFLKCWAHRRIVFESDLARNILEKKEKTETMLSDFGTTFPFCVMGLVLLPSQVPPKRCCE